MKYHVEKNRKNLKKLKKVLAFLKTLVYTKQVGCEQRSTEQYGQLVKGLRRRPLTAKTRVRFPYWLLKNNQSFLWLFFFPNLSKNIESPKTVLKNSEGYGMI